MAAAGLRAKAAAEGREIRQVPPLHQVELLPQMQRLRPRLLPLPPILPPTVGLLLLRRYLLFRGWKFQPWPVSE